MTVSFTAECDCCDFAASSFQCPRHPLMGGKNLTAQLVKEMHQASLMGHLWGDSMYELEQAELAAETPAQLSARLVKKEAAEEAGAQALKQYELQKRALINIDPKTGKPTRYSGMACRDAEEPAKWVLKGELLFDAYGEKVLDNKGRHKRAPSKEWAATDPKAKSQPAKRPIDVPAGAVFWSYGCEYHAKGKCEHLHPGQPGYEAAKAVADAKKADKKHAGAEAIMANACYLSSKPVAPKPSPLSNSVPVMRDAW